MDLNIEISESKIRTTAIDALTQSIFHTTDSSKIGHELSEKFLKEAIEKMVEKNKEEIIARIVDQASKEIARRGVSALIQELRDEHYKV